MPRQEEATVPFKGQTERWIGNCWCCWRRNSGYWVQLWSTRGVQARDSGEFVSQSNMKWLLNAGGIETERSKEDDWGLTEEMNQMLLSPHHHSIHKKSLNNPSEIIDSNQRTRERLSSFWSTRWAPSLKHWATDDDQDHHGKVHTTKALRVKNVPSCSIAPMAGIHGSESTKIDPRRI